MALAITPAASSAPAGADRAAVLDAVRESVMMALGRPVRFVVDRITQQGDWVLLWARMVDDAGRPMSYAGTPLAEAERDGMVSKSTAALLKRADRQWTVVEVAIGPTDVAWEGWGAKHGAPTNLFG